MRCIIGILCKLTIGISVQVIKIFVNFFAISFSVTFQITAEIFIYTRMWASAQRDGRPSKWRPVFNATNFGWRPLLECRAVTLPRHEIRWNLLGCPKCANKSQPLEGRSSPYCEHMWGRHCCLTSFFSIVDICLSCEDIARQSCAMVPRWWIFGDFLGPAFPASRVQHISDLHSKFALRPHHVSKYGRPIDIQSVTAEIRRGKKKDR